MPGNIYDAIPTSNTLSVPFARFAATGQKAAILESSYSSGFIGAFQDTEEHPEWSRRVARYDRDQWRAETSGAKVLGDLLPQFTATGDGECHQNHRYSIEAYEAAGRIGVEPFTTAQDFGSCVDASLSELLTAILGYRIGALKKNEVWRTSAAWYAYALRGYCGDGWEAWGAASAIKKLGVGYRMAYEISDARKDQTEDDYNEYTMARSWCRSGPPADMRRITNEQSPIDDNYIVEFQGGVPELKKVFANGGVLHFSGTRNSGGPKPFTPGSVGPHQMTAYGYDDSEAGRKFFKDVVGYSLAADDVAVHCGQSWGPGWGAECADKYWPPHWGPKTEGSWICSGKWFLKSLSADMVYFPEAFRGFQGDPLPPQPTDPKWEGTVYAEQLPSGLIAIRGEVSCDGKPAIIVPDGAGRYKPTPKPVI